ncbi:MAG: hypothetical protein JWM34_3292 [Ilumatobacteraceae bacterium]|nr:hypothetical protein [Ilumatobacteraceae bacterium]
MARWRNPELESVFGGALDDDFGFSAENVERIVAAGTPETDLLEFKTGLYQGPGGAPWTDKQELCKDVAELANHRGGVLLLGVKTTAGIAVGLRPITTTNTDTEEMRLRAVLAQYQAPLAQSYCYWIPAGGPNEYYVAIVVPPSPRQPHSVVQVNDERRSHFYPVRDGSGTRFMAEAEIGERYRLRDSARQDQARRFDSVIASAWTELEWTGQMWLYVAAVPESPVSVQLNAETVLQISEWEQHERRESPMGRTLDADGHGIPRPGGVTFTGLKVDPMAADVDICDAYVELHVDGSAFIAKPAQAELDLSTGEVLLGEFSLVDDVVQLVDFAVRWTEHQSGPWGNAILRCGFMDSDPNRDPSELTSGLRLARRSVGATMMPRPRSRTVTRAPHADVLVDLAHVGTMQERLVVTYEAASGLFHHFGIAEPDQLSPDGRISPARFEGRSREVFDWAQLNNVPWFGDRTW